MFASVGRYTRVSLKLESEYRRLIEKGNKLSDPSITLPRFSSGSRPVRCLYLMQTCSACHVVHPLHGLVQDLTLNLSSRFKLAGRGLDRPGYNYLGREGGDLSSKLSRYIYRS